METMVYICLLNHTNIHMISIYVGHTMNLGIAHLCLYNFCWDQCRRRWGEDVFYDLDSKILATPDWTTKKCTCSNRNPQRRWLSSVAFYCPFWVHWTFHSFICQSILSENSALGHCNLSLIMSLMPSNFGHMTIYKCWTPYSTPSDYDTLKSRP